MNKVILGLILAVCVLGMALVMLNERLGRKTDMIAPQVLTEARTTPRDSTRLPEAPPMPPASGLANEIETVEREEARVALAPPQAPEKAPLAAPPVPGAASLPEPARVEPAPAVVPAPLPKPAPEARPAPEAKPAPAPKPEPKPAPLPRPEPKATQAEQPKSAPAKAQPDKKGAREITRFVVFSREKGATIRIGGNQGISQKSMVLENPDRVVIDMDGDWTFPPNPGIPKNELVNNVRVGKMGDKTRVVIDLKTRPRSARVIPSKNGDSVDIRVDK